MEQHSCNILGENWECVLFKGCKKKFNCNSANVLTNKKGHYFCRHFSRDRSRKTTPAQIPPPSPCPLFIVGWAGLSLIPFPSSWKAVGGGIGIAGPKLIVWSLLLCENTKYIFSYQMIHKKQALPNHKKCGFNQNERLASCSQFWLATAHAANEGLVRIQYKCLDPIYVYAKMKLRGLVIPKHIYNVLSSYFLIHVSVSIHECRNWERGRAVSFPGIYVWIFGTVYCTLQHVILGSIPELSMLCGIFFEDYSRWNRVEI